MKPDIKNALSQEMDALEYADLVSRRLNASPDDPLTVKGVHLLFRIMAEASAMFGVRDGAGVSVRAQMANYGLEWRQIINAWDHRPDGFYLFKNRGKPLAFVSYPRVTIDPGASVELDFITFDPDNQFLRQEK